MKNSDYKRTKTNRNRTIIISAAAILLLTIALIWANHSRSKSVTVVTPAVTSTPSPTNNGTSGDASKSQYASPSPTPTMTTISAPSSTPSPSAAFVSSFTVTTRSDGFHVATVLSGVTSGTCQVTITPAGSASAVKSGTVILSGTTYMCDFGGDIAGRGTTGLAQLMVTSGSGATDSQTVNF